MTTDEIYAATILLAERFRDMEQHEWALYLSDEHRDVELVRWVIRCLANPGNDFGPVLDTVWERRHRVGVVA